MLFANARFMADFSKAPGNEFQISIQNLIHAEDLQQFLFGMKSLLLNPKLAQKLEIRVCKADATYAWMLVQMTSASPSATSGPQELLVQLSDIHAAKTTTLHLQKQESRWNGYLDSDCPSG